MSKTNHFAYILEDGFNIVYNEIHLVEDINDPNDHSIAATLLITEFHENAVGYMVELPENFLIGFNKEEGNYIIGEKELEVLSYIRLHGKPIL